MPEAGKKQNNAERLQGGEEPSAHDFEHTITVVEGRDANGKVVKDLGAAIEKAGWKFHHLRGINPIKMAKMEFDDVPLENIIFRDLSQNTHFDMARLKKWVDKNYKVAINMDAVGGRASTSDKYFQHGLFLLDDELKKHTLPLFQVDTAADVEALIEHGELEYPVVLKPRFGTAGRGIKLARNRDELFGAYQGPQSGILAEQYVEADHDWRVFVMGGTAVGIMKKTGDPEHPEDFRMWSGGKTKAREEDSEIIDKISHLACKAADVSKLEYTGVDIIQDKRTKKFYVLETNFAAGWQNRFIETTGENIAERTVEWVIDRAKIRELVKGRTDANENGDMNEGGDENEGARKGLLLEGLPRVGLDKKAELVKDYIEKRLKRLPRAAREDYKKILAGDQEAIKKHEKALDKYNYYRLEDVPLSWAGNFIGPDTGTLEEGAIITALWLRRTVDERG